jgi:hypothetical protein
VAQVLERLPSKREDLVLFSLLWRRGLTFCLGFLDLHPCIYAIQLIEMGLSSNHDPPSLGLPCGWGFWLPSQGGGDRGGGRGVTWVLLTDCAGHASSRTLFCALSKNLVQTCSRRPSLAPGCWCPLGWAVSVAKLGELAAIHGLSWVSAADSTHPGCQAPRWILCLFRCLFFTWCLANFLPGLASNHDPLDL